ncbi:glycerate kinase [Weissella confusa]|uniref:Glycerate kinase n=1 Tax=Weissella confusa TaxID=1583 RepID=A0A923SP88_WEICO|nr:glycerate kinase [Weissella confusa]
MQAGLQKIFPDAEYELVPMADGGEGTVQSLVDATNGQLITTDVQNPLYETVSAFYGVLGDQQTADVTANAMHMTIGQRMKSVGYETLVVTVMMVVAYVMYVVF